MVTAQQTAETFDSLALVLAHCEDRHFTGLLLVEVGDGIGQIRLLSGIVESASLNGSKSDNALDRIRGSRLRTLEATATLPSVNARTTRGLLPEGALGTMRPVELMRFCEKNALSCTLTVRTPKAELKITYDRGDLRTLEPESAMNPELLEACEGDYCITLPQLGPLAEFLDSAGTPKSDKAPVAAVPKPEVFKPTAAQPVAAKPVAVIAKPLAPKHVVAVAKPLPAAKPVASKPVASKPVVARPAGPKPIVARRVAPAALTSQAPTAPAVVRGTAKAATPTAEASAPQPPRKMPLPAAEPVQPAVPQLAAVQPAAPRAQLSESLQREEPNSEAPGSAPAITLEPEPMSAEEANLSASSPEPQPTTPQQASSQEVPVSIAAPPSSVERRVYPRVYLLLALLIGAAAIMLWRTYR